MRVRKIHTEVALLTDIGKMRQQNQDALAFDSETGLYVVCDGMGGAAAGDLASRMAVDTFLAHARQGWLEEVSPEQKMEGAAIAANHAVYEYAEENPRLRGMGTTLVAISVPKAAPGAGDEVPCVLAHVGDSRCYRLRDSRLDLMTEDHSLVAEQVRMGEISAAEAAWSPVRNVITRAVGSQPDVETEVQTLAAQSGDIYLLCSDGLTHDLTDWRLEEILKHRGLKLDAAARQLVDAANAAGGPDNISVMLVRVKF